jgi:hypothetical protein
MVVIELEGRSETDLRRLQDWLLSDAIQGAIRGLEDRLNLGVLVIEKLPGMAG